MVAQATCSGFPCRLRLIYVPYPPHSPSARIGAQGSGYEAHPWNAQWLTDEWSRTDANRYFPMRALPRPPLLPNSCIREVLARHWILADPSLPSREGQVQTKRPDKDEGKEPQAQKQ